jgi:hypothetical protein
MSGLCRIVVAVLGILYVAVLALFAVGTWGLFGSPQGPLAGVFLVPLGLPWILLIEDVHDAVRPWLAALAPLLNLVILIAVCRLAAARRGS